MTLNVNLQKGSNPAYRLACSCTVKLQVAADRGAATSSSPGSNWRCSGSTKIFISSRRNPDSWSVTAELWAWLARVKQSNGAAAASRLVRALYAWVNRAASGQDDRSDSEPGRASAFLPVDRRRPVEDDGQRRRAAGLLWRRRDEEALPVFGHGVDLVARESPDVCAKEGLRQSGIE